MSDTTKPVRQFNFSRFIVRTTHGSADRAATMEKIGQELDNFLEGNVEVAKIAEAVASVYSSLPEAQNKQIDISAVINRAVRALNPDVDEETRVSKSVREFIRAESELFEETSGERGAYHVKKGPGGGCRLSTTVYVKQYKEFVAKKAAAAK